MFNKVFSVVNFYRCVLTILLLISFKASATHIVGGDLTYEYLSANTYRVKLTIYRDCFNGRAPYDNPAHLGIFDSNNTLLQVVDLTFKGSQPIPIVIKDPCTTPPANVCYEVTTYDTVLVLPSIPGGYTLAYQRCCRNMTIVNIIAPGASGATYYAHIPGSEVVSIDSNPRFKNLAPTFTCAATAFSFDQSATDDEGDSLVYELSEPFLGADSTNSQPSSPIPPPYTPVTWSSPFSIANLMGGVPLSINPKTGIMTAVPNTIGQFVIGVRVKEYRNGVYIGETTRDFQVNVTPCGKTVVSSILTPSTVCGSKLATFTNNSTGASKYRWDFNTNVIANDTSLLASPSYTYADTGSYRVQLVAYASNNSNCSDTAYGIVNIYPKTVSNYGFIVSGCSLTVSFSDSSKTTVHHTNSYSWNFGDGSPISKVKNPVHTFPAAGTYSVKLVTVNSNGCSDSITKSVTLYSPPPNNAGPDMGVCVGKSTNIGASGNTSQYSYTWSPTGGLGNPNSTTTSAAPVITTTYVRTATILNNGCISRDTVVVTVNPLPVVNVGTTTRVCIGFGATIGAPPIANYSYLWAPSTALSSTTIANPVTTTTMPRKYYLNVTNNVTGCINNDSLNITIVSTFPVIDAGADKFVCKGANTYIGNTNTPIYRYTWHPGKSLSDSILAIPVATPSVTTQYKLVAFDSTGTCFSIDSMVVTAYAPPADAGIDKAACIGSGTTIGSSNNSQFSYLWRPATGLNDTTISSPFAQPIQSMQYVLMVTDKNNGCRALDSVNVTVNKISFTDAGPITTVCARDSFKLGSTTNNLAYNYNWNPLTFLNNSTAARPVCKPLNSITYTLTITDPLTGCKKLDTVNVNVNPLPVINPTPNVIICTSDSRATA
jgi:PKD repeat protein